MAFPSKTRSEELNTQITVQALCTLLLSCCLEIQTIQARGKKSDYSSYCVSDLTKHERFHAVLLIHNSGSRDRSPC